MRKLLLFLVIWLLLAILFVIAYPKDVKSIIDTLANLEIVEDVKDFFVNIEYAEIWKSIKEFFSDLTL